MKKRNLDAPATKRDLIEFAERVITAIQRYTDQRKKLSKITPAANSTNSKQKFYQHSILRGESLQAP